MSGAIQLAIKYSALAQGKSDKRVGAEQENYEITQKCSTLSIRLTAPNMKRSTANVPGDNPEDSAPAADNKRDQTLHHLGVAPPHVSSQYWFLGYDYLGNAPLLACACAGSA
ncbi:hypothetical protein HMPREF0201_00048 [Cedecea davisae DSM 4568]|uniref:Uncharacterized protein n=1 Tax=Cedecea davisae DSM 4568 TaxID=566551 RepID=S3JJI7_9ENTR|nr:hypothetical protein HMPREF0201_00048 [Cedecea davisae DSM 4568]